MKPPLKESETVELKKSLAEVNPGRLYGNLTIDDLRKGNVSQRRNPLIADLFRRISMVEAWGRGMPLILKHAPDEAFREIGNLFNVSFGRPSFMEQTDEGEPAAQGTTQEDSPTSHKTIQKTSPKAEPECGRCALQYG